MRAHSVPVLAMLTLLIGGCALSGTVTGGAAEPAIAVDGGPMPWPECQTGDYAFAGESTLAAIGLGEFAGGPDANKVGMIWVTAGPASIDAPMPAPAGGGNDPAMPAQRMVCVQWPDGSGMAGNIPDDWVPPASLIGAAVSDEGTTGLPIGVLALVIGAAVLIGVSVMAFRREGA